MNYSGNSTNSIIERKSKLVKFADKNKTTDKIKVNFYVSDTDEYDKSKKLFSDTIEVILDEEDKLKQLESFYLNPRRCEYFSIIESKIHNNTLTIHFRDRITNKHIFEVVKLLTD